MEAGPSSGNRRGFFNAPEAGAHLREMVTPTTLHYAAHSQSPLPSPACRPPQLPLVSLCQVAGEDVEPAELIGWQWCHSGGRPGPKRRDPPLSDGDWIIRSSPWLGLVGGGVKALGPSGQPREVVAPGAAPLESLRTLYLIAPDGGRACRVMGAGRVVREVGGLGGHDMRGSGWWWQN